MHSIPSRVTHAPSRIRHALLLALPLLCASAMAETRYSATLIQSTGGEETSAVTLNDAGQVAGNLKVNGSSVQTFLTGADGQGMQKFTAPAGGMAVFSVNASGLLGGNFADDGRASVTNSQTGLTEDLSPWVGDRSNVYGISDTGVVTGLTYDVLGTGHSFVLDLGSKAVKWLPNSSSDAAIEPSDISANGTVVGTLMVPPVKPRIHNGYNAYMVQPPYTQPVNLHNPKLGAVSYGIAVNSSLQTVGQYTPRGTRHTRPFIAGPGVLMHDLGLPKQYDARALDINDAGVIVGSYSAPAAGWGGFLVQADGSGFTLLDSVTDMPAGLHVYSASRINNQGQILVQGTDFKNYLLTPQP